MSLGNYIQIHKGDEWFLYHAPEDMQSFIWYFDEGGKKVPDKPFICKLLSVNVPQVE